MKRSIQANILIMRTFVAMRRYVDDTVLTMLDKRADGVTAEIYTMQISKAFQLDIDKHNLQYAPISVNIFKNLTTDLLKTILNDD